MIKETLKLIKGHSPFAGVDWNEVRRKKIADQKRRDNIKKKEERTLRIQMKKDRETKRQKHNERRKGILNDLVGGINEYKKKNKR